jgi:RNA polymerase sigma factor (sigma-70 family)
MDEHPQALPQKYIEMGLIDYAYGRAFRDRLIDPRLTGPERDLTDLHLVNYGLRTMTAMVANGMIFEKFRRLTGGDLGGGLFRERLRGHCERDDLVNEAVEAGYRRFYQNLRDGNWSPVHQASLRTYFLNGCVLAFKQPYRRWHHARENENSGPVNPARYQDGSDFTGAVELRNDFNTFLCSLSRRDRTIFVMSVQGYSQAEIARDTGTSVRAVEGILRRRRAEWEKFYGRGTGK